MRLVREKPKWICGWVRWERKKAARWHYYGKGTRYSLCGTMARGSRVNGEDVPGDSGEICKRCLSLLNQPYRQRCLATRNRPTGGEEG